MSLSSLFDTTDLVFVASFAIDYGVVSAHPVTHYKVSHTTILTSLEKTRDIRIPNSPTNESRMHLFPLHGPVVTPLTQVRQLSTHLPQKAVSVVVTRTSSVMVQWRAVVVNCENNHILSNQSARVKAFTLDAAQLRHGPPEKECTPCSGNCWRHGESDARGRCDQPSTHGPGQCSLRFAGLG